MELPKIALIEQHFNPIKIKDIHGLIIGEMSRLRLGEKIKSGDSVAITGGSRGIANIDIITKTVVDELKGLGAKPFIFPSMGSHGGATSEGQIRVLERFGITEANMGCPIRSTMDVKYLGDAVDGYPIYVDKYASEADHIVLINRIKPHTKFKGPLESGLMKMMAIGMGKQKGAEYYHKAAVKFTFQKIISTVGLEVIKKCPILFGLAIVENGYDQTSMLQAILPDDIPEEEEKLLSIAKQRMARLPFHDIDVLIVDEIGKNISGTGMDVNITGRNRDILGDFTTGPFIKRIFVRNLSKESEGNALGIGLADFTTTRLIKNMDIKKTYINCITAISPEKGSIPMYFDTDREALEACLWTIGGVSAPEVRLVYIKNTLELSKMYVSEAFKKELRERNDLKILSRWEDIPLDTHGNMTCRFDE
jgi:hypothetical protein